MHTDLWSIKAEGFSRDEAKVSSNHDVQVQRETIQGVDALFAAPSTTAAKGMLFVAHGCSHTNTDWFVDCENCIGLPEERAIVEMALEEFHFVVVAISSTNRQSKCWSLRTDMEPVGKVLRELSGRYKNNGATSSSSSFPIFAFGASSGGSFVSGLATPLQQQFGIQLAGFLSQIAASQTDETAQCQVYITMKEDQQTDLRAQQLLQTATAKGNGATPTPTKHIRVPKLAITNDYFSSRIPVISSSDSARMTQALVQANMLDADGYLVDSPRQSTWREVLQSQTPPIGAVTQDPLTPDASPISEVMNVADGVHELTRDGVKEGLEF
ncbi:MAG: hypothetical protein SGARI_006094, partial [Bacillariaceae sp.]